MINGVEERVIRLRDWIRSPESDAGRFRLIVGSACTRIGRCSRPRKLSRTSDIKEQNREHGLDRSNEYTKNEGANHVVINAW